MEDELEDKVFYQTYVIHMKILSKFAVGASSINTPLAYLWKLCRLYIFRPEVICCGVILFCFFLYLQAVDTWSRGILARIQATLSGRHKSNRTKFFESTGHGDQQCWEDLKAQSAAFAILGRRPRMEDRFIIEENINNNTGISFFAIFDGHGGEFAADFAKDILVRNIYNKVIETTKLLNGSTKAIQERLATTNKDMNNIILDADDTDKRSSYLKLQNHNRNVIEGKGDDYNNNKENASSSSNLTKLTERKNTSSLRKVVNSYDDCNVNKKYTNDGFKGAHTTDTFTLQLNSLLRTAGANSTFKENFLNNNNNNNKTTINKNNNINRQMDAKCYIENGKINFDKLLTDEVLAADHKLVEAAKKMTNIAGTTALIAIIHGTRLVVANVGDSRGVMCNARGIAIPLSFDHKPQQVRERKRIHDAGGYIAFRGVWRVAGILATSRALGDYPLKDKNLVIANPDILTFELNYHKPVFIILASDGLWDTFSNEEACSYIKEHLHEPDFGAKSLALQSYNRGSVDNITVLVIVFRNGIYRITSSSTTTATQNYKSNKNHTSSSKCNSNNISSASLLSSTSMCLHNKTNTNDNNNSNNSNSNTIAATSSSSLLSSSSTTATTTTKTIATPTTNKGQPVAKSLSFNAPNKIIKQI